MRIPFHSLTTADKEFIQQRVQYTNCRNCDLNFMNLIGWRFLYDTEVADYKGWLLFRFKADGHLAYLAPIGQGSWKDILREMIEDAKIEGHPFLMLGVCENSLKQLDNAMPGYFYATADRAYADYIYQREKLISLTGKKLQPKRNFANRFVKLYPDYQIIPLTTEYTAQCIELYEQWKGQKTGETESGRYTLEAESQAIRTVLEKWDELGGQGILLKAEGNIIAFTYGTAINYDTFGVCVEKANTHYEGAFAMINREFARSIPEQYTLINREEDLGMEGLRRAKLSYQPEIILQKYTVMTKHPFSTEADAK